LTTDGARRWIMEFDKNKILTCVTADQAKVGMKGWFADTLELLEEKVKCSNPNELIGVLDEAWRCRFEKETNTLWALFYPAPEPTYRPFTNDELNDLVGKVITTKTTGNNRVVSEKICTGIVKVGDGEYTAENLLEWYTLGGQPCGVREEA